MATEGLTVSLDAVNCVHETNTATDNEFVQLMMQK